MKIVTTWHLPLGLYDVDEFAKKNYVYEYIFLTTLIRILIKAFFVVLTSLSCYLEP